MTVRRLLVALSVVPGIAAVAIGIAGPWFAPDQLGRPVGRPFARAGDGLLLGGDALGRNVWSELLYGGRALLIVPIIATIVTGLVGGLLGVVSAYAHPWVDRVASKLVDVLIALPSVLVLLVLVNGWGSSPTVLVVAVVATSGPYAMRFVRAATLQVVTAGFVEQAVAQGESTFGVIIRELVPNVAGPLLADASNRLVGSIYLVAAASFLGFGPDQPSTDWAQMVNENLSGAGLNAWAVVAPTLAIVALTTSVMSTADRLGRRWAR